MGRSPRDTQLCILQVVRDDGALGDQHNESRSWNKMLWVPHQNVPQMLIHAMPHALRWFKLGTDQPDIHSNVHFGGFSCPLNHFTASVWAIQLIKLLPVRTFGLVHNVEHFHRLCYGNSILAHALDWHNGGGEFVLTKKTGPRAKKVSWPQSRSMIDLKLVGFSPNNYDHEAP